MMRRNPFLCSRIDARPLALGIHWAHDASIAICSPEGIVFALAEERVSRIKHYYGFPRQAIETALDYCGLTGNDISIVAFSTSSVLFPQQENFASIKADGSSGAPAPKSAVRAIGGSLKRGTRDFLSSLRSPDETPDGLSDAWEGFEDRRWSRYQDFMTDVGLMSKNQKYYYIAHHRAHAASAYHLSGLEEACVLTMDGKGDGLSSTIYAGRENGELDLLRSSPATDSLGAFYQAITEALGFIPVDGEYKTMGLAALSNGNGHDNPFTSIVSVRDGVLDSEVDWAFRSFNHANPDQRVPNPLGSVSQTEDFKPLLEDMPREEFAYFAQEHCEQNMVAIAKDALKISGSRNLVGAGGVMLNVKGNALIRDELRPDNLFIYPDSGDSGLAAGAAMEALRLEGAHTRPARLQMPYFGHSFTDSEISVAVNNFADEHSLLVTDVSEDAANAVGEQLEAGKVIGTFQGRLEMGPRALGNRSVLADPRSNEVKDRINLILKGREYFVPFAPIVLEEEAGLYWEGSTDYRYMTITVDASDHAKKTIPAVVHVDGSMRPQVVAPDHNQWLYRLLQAFKTRTGVGVLINTSFNRHGLPIVSAPSDALEHLLNGWVDGLIIGDWYVEKMPDPTSK